MGMSESMIATCHNCLKCLLCGTQHLCIVSVANPQLLFAGSIVSVMSEDASGACIKYLRSEAS